MTPIIYKVMKSQKEIIRLYNKMSDIHRIKVKDNRVNCYICKSCKTITKIIDRDRGVTPFFMNCGTCGGEARSTFYNDIVPDQKPTIEFYRPSLKETLKLNEGLLDHVLNGGLLYRKINNK